MNPLPSIETAPSAWARFDDLQANQALRFGPPHRVVVATCPAEVAPALAEVDRATREGQWAFGYVSYEAAPGLDDRLVTREPGPGAPPLLWFGLCAAAPSPVPVVEPSRDTAQATGVSSADAPSWRRGWDPEEYRDAVRRVREHIAAGETYQCNLTVRLRGQLEGNLERRYADLALGQRAAYSAYLDTGRFVIASASPELFFSWRGDLLTTRPMKGTAPRGRDLAEDQRNGAALRASPKERAENIMIVDLMRNDLARIARTGGVSVTSLCAVERYETVLQLTSEITARPRPEVGLVDIFRALFPSGSVTGAPKARTMRLIRELEDSPRGVYCGAIGMVGPPGSRFRARFNVAIRTVVVDRSTGEAEYGTGGGITWGSDPTAEHAELLVKSAVLHSQPSEFHLMETMRYERDASPGGAPSPGQDSKSVVEGLQNRERHLARLARSARYFGFPFDSRRALEELATAIAGVDAALVRLRLYRSGALRVETEPLPPALDRPVVLAVDSEPVDSSQRWLYHKTSRREPYTSRRRRHPEADDVLMVNERGEVTETTIANLAVRLAGRWWTPPVSSGLLPGIERERLIAAGTLGVRTLRLKDLRQAEALAVVSSLRGWRPAVLAR